MKAEQEGKESVKKDKRSRIASKGKVLFAKKICVEFRDIIVTFFKQLISLLLSMRFVRISVLQVSMFSGITTERISFAL